MGRIEVRQVIEFIEPPNEKVFPYTIMYHGMARLSNEKAKFFLFFGHFLSAVEDRACTVCDAKACATQAHVASHSYVKFFSRIS